MRVCLSLYFLHLHVNIGSGGFGVAFYSVTNFFADILENGNNSCIHRGYLEKSKSFPSLISTAYMFQPLTVLFKITRYI